MPKSYEIKSDITISNLESEIQELALKGFELDSIAPYQVTLSNGLNINKFIIIAKKTIRKPRIKKK